MWGDKWVERMILVCRDMSSGTTSQSPASRTNPSAQVHQEFGSSITERMLGGRGSGKQSRSKKVGEERAMMALMKQEGAKRILLVLSSSLGK